MGKVRRILLALAGLGIALEGTAQRLLFTEVMTDPPTVGPLARVPYIEIRNSSALAAELSDMTLLYRKTKYALPACTLGPGAFAVLCPDDPFLDTGALGPAVRLPSFPALSGTFTLTLLDREGKVYDHLEMDDRLREPGLEDEGRSLERVSIDPPQWRCSQDYRGGTPGEPTMMKPYETVPAGALVINELLLSPETTGEKYLELYNASALPIDLDGLFLRYRNLPTSTPSAWALTVGPYTLGAGEYVVLTPYPPALERLHPLSDPSTFVERIDFPSLSPAYCEMELVARADRAVVDRAVYRRQWLGETSADRTHHALERVSPTADGTLHSSWRKATDAAQGGTPGRPNSVSGAGEAEWPEEPQLSYEQLTHLLPLYSSHASLEVYSLTGEMVCRCRGEEVLRMVDRLRSGRAALPTMVCVIRITLTHPSDDFGELVYTGRWLHTPAMQLPGSR